MRQVSAILSDVSMGKETLIIILGVLIALTPFLGFPRSWETVFFVVAGLGIVAVTIFFQRERQRLLRRAKQQETSSFGKSNMSQVSSQRNALGSVEKDSHERGTTID